MHFLFSPFASFFIKAHILFVLKPPMDLRFFYFYFLGPLITLVIGIFEAVMLNIHILVLAVMTFQYITDSVSKEMCASCLQMKTLVSSNFFRKNVVPLPDGLSSYVLPLW